jgi:Tol biopolymer transport system component
MIVGSKKGRSWHFFSRTRVPLVNLLVASSLCLLAAPVGSKPLSELAPVPSGFTDGVGKAGAPDRIVFSGRYCDAGQYGGGSSECNFDIYSVTLDGSEPQLVLLNYGTDDVFPAFSPDGTEIAYNSWEKEWGCDSHVWLVEADGTAPRMISSPVNAWDETFGWTPDGGLAYTRWPNDPACNYGYHSDIYLLSRTLETWTEEALVSRPGSEIAPEFSPNGRRMVYAYDADDDPVPSPGESEQTDVWVARADGTRHRRLTRTPRLIENDATWSPDGRTIAFSRGSSSASRWWIPEGRGSIWLMRPDGSRKRRLTQPGYLDLDPAWSPDGTRVAFTRCFTKNDPPDCAIAVVRVTDPDSVELVVYTEGYISQQPSWHPAP